MPRSRRSAAPDQPDRVFSHGPPKPSQSERFTPHPGSARGMGELQSESLHNASRPAHDLVSRPRGSPPSVGCEAHIVAPRSRFTPRATRTRDGDNQAVDPSVVVPRLTEYAVRKKRLRREFRWRWLRHRWDAGLIYGRGVKRKRLRGGARPRKELVQANARECRRCDGSALYVPPLDSCMQFLHHFRKPSIPFRKSKGFVATRTRVGPGGTKIPATHWIGAAPRVGRADRSTMPAKRPGHEVVSAVKTDCPEKCRPSPVAGSWPRGDDMAVVDVIRTASRDGIRNPRFRR